MDQQLKKWASTQRIHWKRQIGWLSIRFSYRGSDSFMGRFGGGWNWKVGIQVGGTTALISLLVAELILSWKKPE